MWKSKFPLLFQFFSTISKSLQLQSSSSKKWHLDTTHTILDHRYLSHSTQNYLPPQIQIQQTIFIQGHLSDLKQRNPWSLILILENLVGFCRWRSWRPCWATLFCDALWLVDIMWYCEPCVVDSSESSWAPVSQRGLGTRVWSRMASAEERSRQNDHIWRREYFKPEQKCFKM